MFIKQLSVFVENESGRLKDVTRILYENGINIYALSIADTSEFGIFRIIVDDDEKAVQVLRDSDFSVKLTDVFCICVPHMPGGLYKIIDIFSNNSVNIEYMYAFPIGKEAPIIIKTDDVEKALEVINKNNLKVWLKEDICK